MTSEPTSHTVVNLWSQPHHYEAIKDENEKGQGDRGPSAATTTHQEIQSFPRHQEQTASYIYLFNQNCHMATPSCPGGWQSKHLAEYVSGLSQSGGFVSTRKWWHAHKDNFAFLQNHHCYDERLEPFMLHQHDNALHVDFLMFCSDISCFCSPRRRLSTLWWKESHPFLQCHRPAVSSFIKTIGISLEGIDFN